MAHALRKRAYEMELGILGFILRYQTSTLTALIKPVSRRVCTFLACTAYFRGSSDYIGLNHYSAYLVEPLPEDQKLNWANDEGLEYSYDPSWISTQSDWLKVRFYESIISIGK